MGQNEIIAFLRKHSGQKFTEKEIRKAFGRRHYLKRPLASLRKYSPENFVYWHVKGYRGRSVFVYCWRDVV
jgi:hypothetical protein